jgi:hypothetical protein
MSGLRHEKKGEKMDYFVIAEAHQTWHMHCEAETPEKALESVRKRLPDLKSVDVYKTVGDFEHHSVPLAHWPQKS